MIFTKRESERKKNDMSLNMTVVRSFARTFTEDELEKLIEGCQQKITANLGALTSASTSGTSYTRQGAKSEEEMLALYEAALYGGAGDFIQGGGDIIRGMGGGDGIEALRPEGGAEAGE